MPLYMDIHNLPEGTTPEDVAKAHAKDMETQRKYGVEYHKYWVNENGSKVFCLAHAPNAEAAECVHREAHGMMAEKIIEVQPDVAEVFLGGVETNPAGAVLLPGGGADDARSGNPNCSVHRRCKFNNVDAIAGRRSRTCNRLACTTRSCEMRCPRWADAR